MGTNRRLPNSLIGETPGEKKNGLGRRSVVGPRKRGQKGKSNRIIEITKKNMTGQILTMIAGKESRRKTEATPPESQQKQQKNIADFNAKRKQGQPEVFRTAEIHRKDDD